MGTELKMAKECPPEILKKFADHGFEPDWVKGEYAIFIGNYPSGKATKAESMERLKKAAAERFPNAIPENVAEALYPAFDPENKGEVGFVAAAKGLAILFSARIEIRAQLFFSMVDEDGSGKIDKKEFKKFLVFVNETQGLGLNYFNSKYLTLVSGYSDADVNKLNDEVFKELGKTELTIDDVRAVVAARWGA